MKTREIVAKAAGESIPHCASLHAGYAYRGRVVVKMPLTAEPPRQQSPAMKNTSNPSPEQLSALLEAVIRGAPAFEYQQPLTETERRWLGRAEAIVEASGSMPALVEFRVARQNLGTIYHSRDALLLPLETAYGRVELHAPVAARGAFIPAGDTWNGYAALVKLIQNECDDLLVVDPYINSDLFTEFLPHSMARTGVRCLTMRRSENHPGLVAAASKWATDAFGKSKPVEVRYAPKGSLHDRLIIIDKRETWLISQTFKDIAKRSPASVSRAEADVCEMKAAHYDALWVQSIPVVQQA